MLRRLGSHLQRHYIGWIAIFLTLGGGSAYALKGRHTVDKNDLRSNVVRSKNVKNGQIQSADIRDGTVSGTDIADSGVGAVDLAADAKPHRLSFSGPNTDGAAGRHTLLQLGDLEVQVGCDSLIGASALRLELRNTGASPATADASYTFSNRSGGRTNEPHFDHADIAPGGTGTIDSEIAGADGNDVGRSAGVVVYRSDQRTVSIDFSAAADGTVGAEGCRFDAIATEAAG